MMLSFSVIVTILAVVVLLGLMLVHCRNTVSTCTEISEAVATRLGAASIVAITTLGICASEYVLILAKL